MGNVRMFLEDLVNNEKRVSLDYIDTVLRIDYKYRKFSTQDVDTLLEKYVRYISDDDSELIHIEYRKTDRYEIIVTNFSIRHI